MQSTMEASPASAAPTHAESTPPHAATPFAPTELADLHNEDLQAARGVTGIMVTIFIVAMIGYSIIAYLAYRGSS